MQSPININYPYDPEILLFKGNYKLPNGKIEFLNDGFKLILRANLGGFQYGIHKYVAKEVHFHYPSEHTVLAYLISLERMKPDHL
jgi:carbonic anhydrase